MKNFYLDFEIEEVVLVEEDNNVVENKDKVFGIEDIEDIFHKYFSNLVPKMDFEIMGAKVSKAWVHSNCSLVLYMIEY